MPHISKERVKEIKQQLVKKFPDVKFSVSRHHFTMIYICILESPLSWVNGNEDFNHFYLDRYENAGFLKAIKDIANAGNQIEYVDGDYGSIPSFYLTIRLGKWDKDHYRDHKLSTPIGTQTLKLGSPRPLQRNNRY